MKIKKHIAGIGLVLAMALVLGGCGKPTVDERAAEYLTKYDDTFELISKNESESGGQRTYRFSAQKYPGKTVNVLYEATFDQNNMSPFRDDYCNLVFEEENNRVASEIVEAVFAGVDYEIAASGDWAYQYDANTTYDMYSMGVRYFGVILHEAVDEKQLDEDAEKLGQKLAEDKVYTNFRVIYIDDDTQYINGNGFSDYESVKDYDAGFKVTCMGDDWTGWKYNIAEKEIK